LSAIRDGGQAKIIRSKLPCTGINRSLQHPNVNLHITTNNATISKFLRDKIFKEYLKIIHENFQDFSFSIHAEIIKTRVLQ
jgi:hypothetical protein